MRIETVSEIFAWCCGCFGVCLIYIGLFLYENEEKQIQDKVAEWWVRIDDKQKSSRARVAAFMQTVAKLTEAGLDFLFGPRLFSFRIIPVSIYLSLASLCITLAFSALIKPPKPPQPPVKPTDMIWPTVFFVCLAIFPALTKSKILRAVWWSIIPVFLFMTSGFVLFVIRTRGIDAMFVGLQFLLFFFGWSLVCDVGYIALTRLMLRYAQAIDRIAVIIALVIGNFLVLVICFLSPIFVGAMLFRYTHSGAAGIMVSVLCNSIDFFVGSAALFVAVFLLFHRIAWVVIQRPLYAMYRFFPVRDRRWLVAMGIGLLTLPHHWAVALAQWLGRKI
jgi:hypothetical protein